MTSSSSADTATVTYDSHRDLPLLPVTVDELSVPTPLAAAEFARSTGDHGMSSAVTNDAGSAPAAGVPDLADEDDEAVGGLRWCQFDSGPATVADQRTGRRHDVHISLSRDGSVWARVGTATLDWTAVGERRRRVQAAVLDDNAVDTLRFLLMRQRRRQQRLRLLSQRQKTPWTGNALDRCVLTDVELSMTIVGGWNPSYVAAFDTAAFGSGRIDTQILSVRNLREDCRAVANITLNADKQTVRCDVTVTPSTTAPTINACGLRIVPDRTSSSYLAAAAGSGGRGSFSSPSSPLRWGPGRGDAPMFIKYVSMDPNGTDKWYCNDRDERNRYTLTGSYYYAYVKMASCPPPTGMYYFSIGYSVFLLFYLYLFYCALSRLR